MESKISARTMGKSSPQELCRNHS